MRRLARSCLALIIAFGAAGAILAAAPSPASACGNFNTWPLQRIDTSGYKIADNSACKYYLVAPSNVHRNSDNTLTFFGHTVRSGTLNFPSGYYFAIPLIAVSNQALSSGQVNVQSVTGGYFVDRSLIHNTNLSGVYAIAGMNGKTLFVQGSAIVAAGAGNIVAAGAGNIVAAGAGNIVSHDGGSLLNANGLTALGK